MPAAFVGGAVDSLLRWRSIMWISEGDSTLARALLRPENDRLLQQRLKSELRKTASLEDPITDSEMEAMVDAFNSASFTASIGPSSTTATFGYQDVEAKSKMVMVGTHGENIGSVVLSGEVSQTLDVSRTGLADDVSCLKSGSLTFSEAMQLIVCLTFPPSQVFESPTYPLTFSTRCGINASSSGSHLAFFGIPILTKTGSRVEVSGGGVRLFESPRKYDGQVVNGMRACMPVSGATLTASANGRQSGAGAFQTDPGPQTVAFSSGVTAGADSPYTWTWSVDGTVQQSEDAPSLTRTLAPGSHVVSVTISNGDNRSASVSQTVVVPDLEVVPAGYMCNGIMQDVPTECEPDEGGGGSGGGGQPPTGCYQVWRIDVYVSEYGGPFEYEYSYFVYTPC